MGPAATRYATPPSLEKQPTARYCVSSPPVRPQGVNMRPPVAQVTPAIPAGFAAASIALSLFLFPAGSGSLPSLPVGPVADLVTDSVVAALEPAARPPAALASEATASVSHPRPATRPAQPQAVRRDIRQRVVPVRQSPPTSTPVSVPGTPQRAATSQAHGKAKALGRVRGHSPPGLSRPSRSGPSHGRGHSPEKEHGGPGGPPGPPGGGDTHPGHGGDGHGGSGR